MPTSVNPGDGSADQERDIDRKILDAVRSIRYGSVEITIHNSTVVQIERKEKAGFDASGKRPDRPRQR
jgi:hypothetical protein